MLLNQPHYKGRLWLPMILVAAVLLAGVAWGQPPEGDELLVKPADDQDFGFPVDEDFGDKALEGFMSIYIDGAWTSRLFTWATGRRQMFTTVATGEAWFEVKASTLLEVPLPASYYGFTLSVSTDNGATTGHGSILSAALRHCSQVAMVAQMEPERWLLEVRLDNPSWINHNPAGNVIVVHFAAEGQFGCTLVTK